MMPLASDSRGVFKTLLRSAAYWFRLSLLSTPGPTSLSSMKGGCSDPGAEAGWWGNQPFCHSFRMRQPESGTSPTFSLHKRSAFMI